MEAMAGNTLISYVKTGFVWVSEKIADHLFGFLMSSTVIVSLAGAFIAYCNEVLTWFRQALLIPRTLAVASLLGNVAFVAALGSKLRRPSWARYNEDYIPPFVWRWEAAESVDDIAGLTAYCPKDDTRITWREHAVFGDHGECCNCGYKTNKADSLQYEFERIAKHEIERRLRNKEWQKAKDRMAAVADKARVKS